MLSRATQWTRMLMAPALAMAAVLFTGCGSMQIVRAPGALGTVLDAETGRPIRQASIIRQAAPYDLTSTNGTNVTVRTINPRNRWAVEAVSGRDGRFSIHPAVTLDPETFLPFVHVNQREPVDGKFEFRADGYETFSENGSATAADQWRADLKVVKLHRLPAKSVAESAPKP